VPLNFLLLFLTKCKEHASKLLLKHENIKESGYEAQQSPLFYVFVTVFGLDRAQTTIGFEFCMSK